TEIFTRSLHVALPIWVSSFKGLILQCFRRVQAALASWWLPKNPALSLAMCRASPASIRFGPKRNRKTKAWRSGPRLDPVLDPGRSEEHTSELQSREKL